jgi:murein DD-endopeptidase MepM/ murein hydrolase activator NlpD
MTTRIALILFLLLGIAAPALAAAGDAVTPDDLEAARERNAEVSAGLEATDARYEAAIADEIVIRESLHGLASQVTETEQELAILRLGAEDVARETYMTAGSDSGVTTILGSTSFVDIPVRATYLSAANDRDLLVIDEMLAVEAEYRAQVQELDDALARQKDLVAEIESLAQQLLAELDTANAEYRELEAAWQRQEEERKQREEEERRRREAEEAKRRAEAEAALAAAAESTTTTAPAPEEAAGTTTTTTSAPTTTTTAAPATTTTTTVAASTTTTTAGSSEPEATSTTTTTAPAPTTTTTVPTPTPADRVCPVNGASSFSDTWGAPRSGGRTHKGVDMSASRGTPLVAIESGAIYRLSTSSLGGISVYLVGNSGDLYYYAHLDAWAEGLAGGQKVSAGDPVGIVGTTGNSPSWAPHLHLGWKPGNRDWANPYPMVNALCR